MAMPSAGDLVIYGIDAPEGHVSFIPEVGAHAGPSPEEMHTFIVRPAQVTPAVADQSSGPALRPLHPLSGAVVSARNPLDVLPPEVKARLRERPQPEWVAPMLATLTDERFSREGWLFEPKWDGERCLAFRLGGDLRLFSRNRKRLDAKYPEITAAFQRQARESFIADGEIVTFDNGVTSFAKLQQRMQVEHPSPELFAGFRFGSTCSICSTSSATTPGRSRSGTARKCFASAFDFSGSLRFTEHCEREGEAYYREACRKRVGRRHRERRGERVRLPKDARLAQVQVPAGAGARDRRLHRSAGQRIGFGALLIGYYRGGKLVYAGKVGTGFDDGTLWRLGGRLAQLETAGSPFAGDGLPRRGVHWVKPELVAQIGFTEWTRQQAETSAVSRPARGQEAGRGRAGALSTATYRKEA